MSTNQNRKPKEVDSKICLVNGIIYLDGDLGEEVLFSKFDARLNLLESRFKAILIKLKSDGGCIYESAAIAGRIARSPSFITIEANGLVASGALLVLAVGDHRVASKYGSFMHHDSGSYVSGRLTAMKHVVKTMLKEDNKRYGWLAELTKRDQKWWHDMAVPEYYFDADEALEIGLIDEII